MADKPRDKKHPKKLTPRQRALVKNIAGGMSQADAARASGYAKDSARQAGHQAMKHIAESGIGADLLDRHGLTDDVLVTKYILPLLEATEIRFFQTEGKVSEERIVSDNVTRRVMVELVCRMKGLFKAEQAPVAEGVKVFFIDRSTRPPRPKTIEVIPTLNPEELLGDGDS
jgi:hypothetical protein